METSFFSTYSIPRHTLILGDKSNHLGNVLNVITDRKLPINNPENNKVDYYTADVVAYNDYMPFGALMDGRHGYEGKKVRHAYQGSEMDDEVKGEGNSYTTEFRQLDPRLGRWLSIDPKATAWESPYVSMANNPIMFNDVLGDSIGLDNSFSKIKTNMKALEEMAGTAEGKAFLADYAKKGQTIGGVTFKEDGKYHKEGIDLIYYGEKQKGRDGGGETSADVKTIGENGVLKTVGLTIKITVFQGKGWATDNWGFNTIETLFHESFIHANLHTEDYRDDKMINYSNITDKDKERAGGFDRHYQHKHIINQYEKGNNPKALWPNKALNALLKISNEWKLGYTSEQLQMTMWNFDGGYSGGSTIVSPKK